MNMVTDQQRLERLTCLRDLAWNFSIERRRLSIHKRGRKLPIFDMGVIADETECGSACCLIGAAVSHPWFREQGLSLVSGAVYVDGRYTGMHSAGPAFFGITHEEAGTLFNTGYEMTPREKALEVESLIRRYGGTP